MKYVAEGHKLAVIDEEDKNPFKLRVLGHIMSHGEYYQFRPSNVFLTVKQMRLIAEKMSELNTNGAVIYVNTESDTL